MSDEYPVCRRKIEERVQMTNQEAADLLDNLIGLISDNQDSDYDEALKLGIKALRTEEYAEEINNLKLEITRAKLGSSISINTRGN